MSKPIPTGQDPNQPKLSAYQQIQADALKAKKDLQKVMVRLAIWVGVLLVGIVLLVKALS
jgi:hypothetical protein